MRKKQLFGLIALLLALSTPWAASERPPILLISLDTFRADLLSAFGGSPFTTPNLNALADRGAVFSSCVTPSPLTLPAHATLLTGTYPVRTGLHDNGMGKLSPSAPAIAEALKKAGYATRAVIASAVLDERHGLARGFEHYDDAVGPALQRTASDVTGLAIAAIKGAPKGRPLFLWVHYFDCHEPYAAPDPYPAKFPGRPYEAEAAYLDSEIGRLLEAAPPGAVVAVVSDHGESLGEHGEETHGALLYSATVRVPLILAGPATPPAKSLSSPCSLADVAPTLLAQAGLPPLAGAQGVSLLPALAGKALPPRAFPLETWLPYHQFRWSPLVGVTDGRWKWVRGPADRLFDLRADPKEERDLSPRPPREASALKASLPPFPSAAPPSKSVDASLQGLGYLGAAGGRPARSLPDPHERVQIIRRLDEARDLRAAGEAEKAASLIVQITSEDPGNPSAWFELGESLRRKGEAHGAAKALDKAISIAPTLAEAWTSRGHVWVTQGKHEEASKCYRKALATNPDLIQALNPLAAHLLDLNRPGDALPLLERAVSRGFADAYTYLLRGRVRLVQEKADEADRDFTRALALSDDPPATLKAAADAYMTRKRVEEAMRLYDAGMRKFPGFAPNYLTVATFYLQADQPAKALPLFQKALECQLSREERQNVEEIVKGLAELSAGE